jgi:hypothetical protein
MAHDDKPRCPACGRPGEHETVTRFVRPGQRYGFAKGAPAGALAGDRNGDAVEVESCQLEHPNVVAATMSQQEQDDAVAATKAARRGEKKIGQLKAMVERAVSAAQAEVRGAIERGKRDLARLAAQADAEVPVDAAQPVRG